MVNIYPNRNYFKMALLASLLIHATLFAPLAKFKLANKSAYKNIEVAYLAYKKPVLKNETTTSMSAPADPTSNIRQTSQLSAIKTNAPLEANVPGGKVAVGARGRIGEKPIVQNAIQGELVKKLADIKTDIQNRKEIYGIEFPSDLPSDKKPTYASYYQTIRELIRRSLADNYSRSLGKGEVGVTFILRADGKVKKVDLVEKKSTANEYLKNITLRCIKTASPFPPFPDDLNLP